MNQSLSRIVAQLRRSFGFGKSEDNPKETPVHFSNVRILKLTVFTTKGRVVTIEVKETEYGRNVKMEALNKFSQITDLPYFSVSGITEQMASFFKLIRMSNKKIIEDLQVLEELKVVNNEQFLMVVKRLPIDENENTTVVSPTEQQIMEKTDHLPRPPESPTPASPKLLFELVKLNNIELDVKRIFITLAQESAYVLAMTPYADKIILYYRQKILNYIKHHNDVSKVLCTLGFSSETVKIALKLKANNSKLALDWLIENESVDFDNSILINERLSSLRSTPRSSTDSYNDSITSARRDSILSSKYKPSRMYKDLIDGLLEIVRFYSEIEQIIPEESLKLLTRMGFELENAREALTVTHNNKPAAVEWLLGCRNLSLTEFSQGFTPNSIIRKIILESDEVQESLANPKIFCTFISVLNHPSPTNMWSIDPEIGSLMQHIVMTYHEEKNYVAINQFNDSKYPVSALSAPQI